MNVDKLVESIQRGIDEGQDGRIAAEADSALRELRAGLQRGFDSAMRGWTAAIDSEDRVLMNLNAMEVERDARKEELAQMESVKDYYFDAWCGMRELQAERDALKAERDHEKWLRDRAEDRTNAVEDQRDKAMAERDALKAENERLRSIEAAANEFVTDSYRPEPKHDAARFDRLSEALAGKEA